MFAAEYSHLPEKLLLRRNKNHPEADLRLFGAKKRHSDA
jgi:hypothetical protein